MASGSQEKLDFNRNLKEGQLGTELGAGRETREGRPHRLSAPVVPAIEKLLSSDWKERLLGRSCVEAKEVKGEGRALSLSPCPVHVLLAGPQLCRWFLWVLGVHSAHLGLSLSSGRSHAAEAGGSPHFRGAGR